MIPLGNVGVMQNLKFFSGKRLWFVVPFAVVIVLLAWTVRTLNEEVSWQIVDEVSDQLSLSLRTELDNEKDNVYRRR